MTDRHTRYLVGGTLTFLIVLGALLRIWGLSQWEFHGDEAVHLRYAFTDSFTEFFSAVERDTHPPAFYLLIRGLIQAGVRDGLALRMVAIIPGVLLIFFGYFLGYRVSKCRLGGLLMAFVMATSTQIVEQSQTIRQYVLFLLCECLLLISFFRYFLGENRPKSQLVSYFLCALLCTLLHYSAPLFLVATGIVGFVEAWRHRAQLNFRWFAPVWIGGHVLMATLFLLQISFYTGPTISRSYIGEMGSIHGVADLFHRLLGIQNDLFFGIECTSGQPALPLFIGILFLAGLACLMIARKSVIWLTCLIPLVLNIFLAALNLYPLVPFRWCLYLVPLLLIPCVCLLPALGKRFGRWGRIGFFGATIAVLMLNHTTGPISVFDPDSLRLRPHWLFRSSETHELYSLLSQKMGSHDVLVVGNAHIRGFKLDKLLRGPAGSAALLEEKRVIRCGKWTAVSNVGRCLSKGLKRAGRNANVWIVVEQRQRPQPSRDRCNTDEMLFFRDDPCLRESERIQTSGALLLRFEAQTAQKRSLSCR